MIGVGGCVASQRAKRCASGRRRWIWCSVRKPCTGCRPDMLSAVWANRQPVVDISFPEIEKFDRLPEPRAEGPTAFVSIMEGCSKYCTFCVVPYTRGEKSAGRSTPC